MSETGDQTAAVEDQSHEGGGDAASGADGSPVLGALASWFVEEKQAYAHGAHRPLGSYAALSSAYAVLVAGLTWLARRRGARPPERVRLDDLALVTVATAKLSRLIAKDPITSPLRAPFTRFEGPAGEAELAEEVRGVGARHAVGELITCPFCVGQWVATGFGVGQVLAPRTARLAAAVATAIAGADVLQYGFAGLQHAWKRASG